MRHMIVLLVLGVSTLFYTQLRTAHRLLAEQHALLQEQRDVIAAQQYHITQVQRASLRPLAFSQR